MMRRNERSHYDEICLIFKNEIESSLGPGWAVSCVNNTGPVNLRDQVDAICGELGLELKGKKFPSVLTDIVIGATNGDGGLRLAKVEVKGPASSLGLKDYSQLVGYLQVAGLIEVGALLLIEQQTTPSPVSGDLKKLITTGRLLVEWDVSSGNLSETRHFRTGICSYVPDGLVEWVNMGLMGGLSTWSDLAEAIKTSNSI